SAFHADGPDVDMSQHGGNEEDGDDGMDNFRDLHAVNVRSVERQHQDVTADCDGAAAQDHDPVDQLLTGVEAIGGRVVVPNHAAAALQPIDIDGVWDVAGDPHQTNQDHAKRERKGEID